MFFNSIEYFIFLSIVFTLYWFVFNKNLKLQNVLLLISSYYFYSCWDWRFLFLLIFSTFLDYITGIKITVSQNNKKIWLWLSILINLGFLGVFKYYDFFALSFQEMLSNFGVSANIWTLKLILPVGISFYTFHGLSYVIDIYKNKIQPEKNFITYSVFVSFFPLLVAGPIERATHLLPQIKKNRIFNYENAVIGIKQIVWGLFKKIVIADSCATYADQIFNQYESYNGSTLLLCAVFFSFQIYGDFSGYSDIALGTARLFGIELLKNFNYPYFSRDIAEFWRRWHISLSSWFRDYIYIPLGGSKVKKIIQIRNTFIIFLLSGFWHGANWTFIVWGLVNAILFLPLLFSNSNRSNIEIVSIGKILPSLKDFFQILVTFFIVTLAWIFFRADNIATAINILGDIFSFNLFSMPIIRPIFLLFLLIIFVFIEWIGRNDFCPINSIFKKNKLLKLSFHVSLSLCIFLFYGKEISFIYFQF